MRQLHVLGVSDDGDTLLLGTSASGKVTHRVAVDSRLRQAARGQLAAPGSDRAESVLSPKEIQARLRAGATPDEVAKAAQVPVARVLPYFAPVEAERERIVEEARRAILHRQRGPQPNQPLGETVDAHLRDVAGLKDDSVAWTARRRGDGAWVVRLSYVARAARRKAEWLFQPVGRELTALDSSASRLAAEPATAARKKVATPAAKKATAKKAAAKKATAKKATAKKAAAKKAAATKAGVKKAGVKKTGARKAAARPVASRTVAKKAAPKKPAVQKAATRKTTPKPVAKKAVAKKRPATRKAAAPRKVVAVTPPPAKVRMPRVYKPRVLEVVPDPEPIEEPTPVEVVEVAPAPARRPGTRVPVPSWSDVLLGVTGPSEGAAARTEPTPQSSSAGRRRRS